MTTRLADMMAVVTVCAAAAVMFDTTRYTPEIGYDESAAALALSLKDGHFGNPIDPIGPFYTRQVAMDAYPPAYYAVSAIVFEFLGFGIIQARAVSVLFVAGTAVLVYFAGRIAGGHVSGLVSLAAYLYVPLRVYTVVARPDVAIPFFLLAAVLAIELGGRAPRASMLVAGICTSLAVLSHFAGLMAAPLVAVYLIVATAPGARRRTATYVLIGGAVPVAAYLWLMYPHWWATLRHIINYREIGLAGVESEGWQAAWPIRPTLKHFEVLTVYHPALLFAAALVVTAVTAASSRIGRFALDPRARRVCWLFVGLFISVGCYPNIAIYGYYAPIYLCFGAVSIGVIAAAVSARLRIPHTAQLTTAIALCAIGVIALNEKRLSAKTTAGDITIEGVREWSERFAAELDTPVVIATPHWVFSAAGDRVRTFRILTSHNGRATLLDGYTVRNPGFPQPDAIAASLTDRYNEINNVQALLMWHAADRPSHVHAVGERIRRARLNMGLESVAPTAAEYRRLFMGFFDFLRGGFRIEAILFDRIRLSGNGVLLRRAAERAGMAGDWPRVSVTTAGGVEDRLVDSGCAVSVGPPGAMDRRGALWSLELPLTASPALSGRLLVARIAVGSPAAEDVPYAFVTHYPSADEAAIGRSAFHEARVPPLAADAALGISGFVLPYGRRGRDVLIHIRSAADAGVLAAYATEPASVTQVTIAPVLRVGETCDPALSAAMAGVLPSSRPGQRD